MAQNNALKSGIELHVVLSIENGFLGGPCNYDSCFTYGGHEYRICIEQFGIRRISIACEKPVDCSLLLNIFESIEWLLMMFDGRFMTIKSMEIFDSEERSEKYSTTIEKYLKGRLKLYNSADFCRRNMKAIDFYKIDIVAILPKWMKLLDELKIVHPMLLYSVSDTGLPVDCKCATIIQVFEPLTELMKTNLSGYRVVPARPANGKNSWLRRCLETAIRQYGSLIFEKELGNEDKIFNFTDQLKDCRHRIMHISSKQNKKYMSDTQNVLYAAKLFLLYRVIIFNLLGISKELYEQAINVIAKQWDDWYDFVNKGHEFITEFFFYFPLCLHPPPCPLFGIPKTPFLWYHAAKGGFLYAGNLDDGDDWPAGGEYCAAAGFDIPQKCLPGPGPGIGAAADAVHSGGV